LEVPTVTIQLLAIVLACLTADPPAKPMKPVKFGPLTPAAPPKDWVREKPDNLFRTAQFRIPGDDKAAAELTVTGESSPKFGQKFAEWTDTFTEGREVKTSVVNLPKNTVAHLLDVTGTWKYRDRPRDPSSKEELRPDTRVVWVVVVNEDETTHLRLSGPKALVAKQYDEFMKWLKSAK
jgi:hypothetical protein